MNQAASIDDGILNPGEDKLHITVEFLPVTYNGKLEESETIYGLTEWKFSGNDKVGAKPTEDDRNGLVELKL